MLGFDSQVVTNSDFDTAKPITLNLNGHQPIKGIQFIKESNYKAEVWWYFVKKSFFKDSGIKFYHRKFVQDSYVTTTLLLKSNSFLYLPIDAHRYRKHNNSITKNQSSKHISKHINDMFFAIEKLSDLTNGITDKDCLKRLKSRQESYLFFLLMRFPKSNVSFTQLNGFVKKAKALQVYPLKNFIGDDYNGIRYRVLTFIINKKIALLLSMLILRIKHKSFNK
jgi:hypothetical protein